MSTIDVSEANAQIPRRVQNDGAIPWFLVFLYMLLPIGFAWLAYGDIRDSHLHDVLRRGGYEANGEVTESSAARSGVHVSYRFSVDGVPYSGDAVMTAVHYRVPATGTQIPLRYLPKDPHVNQPSDWEWDWGHIVFYLFGLVMLVALGAFVIAGLRKRKLARMGVVVEGRVTGCAPDRKLFTVYYEFTAEDNVGMEGSTLMPEEYEAGAPIPVIYLRGNPKRNDGYPMRGFYFPD